MFKFNHVSRVGQKLSSCKNLPILQFMRNMQKAAANKPLVANISLVKQLNEVVLLAPHDRGNGFFSLRIDIRDTRSGNKSGDVIFYD